MPHARRNKIINKPNYLPPSPSPPFYTFCFTGESLLFSFWAPIHLCSIGAGPGVGLSPSYSSIHHGQEIPVHQFMPCNDRLIGLNGLCLSTGMLYSSTTAWFCLLKPGLFLTQPLFLWCEEVWISTVTSVSRINQNKSWGEQCCVQMGALNCKYIDFFVYV